MSVAADQVRGEGGNGVTTIDYIGAIFLIGWFAKEARSLFLAGRMRDDAR